MWKTIILILTLTCTSIGQIYEHVGKPIYQGYYTNVCKINDYIYCNGWGLHIFSVADPTNITFVKSIENINYSCICTFDNYAVAAGECLFILNITDPVNPVMLDSIYFYDNIDEVIHYGDYIYALKYAGTGHEYSTISIVNIADPENIYRIDGFSFINTLAYLKIKDNYMFGMAPTLYYNSYLTSFDLSDPEEPVQIDEIELWNGGGFSLKGNHAYVSCYDSLQIVDVSNPYDLSIMTSVPLTDFAYYNTIDDEILYVFGASSIWAVDIHNALNPQFRGHLDCLNRPGPNNLTIHGNTGHFIASYLSSSNLTSVSDILTIDLTDLDHPGIMDIYKSPSYFKGLDFSNNRGYIANSGRGILFFDMLDNSFEFDIREYPGPVTDIKMVDTLAYIQVNSDISIASFANIDSIYQINTISDLSICAIENNLLYANSHDSLCIYDISDPVDFIQLYRFENENLGWNFQVKNALLYTVLNDTLYIVDCQNPESPEVICNCCIGFSAFVSHVENNYCYLVNTHNFYILDITSVRPLAIG